jgi:DNA mismatch endonuclease (patch repair protein)
MSDVFSPAERSAVMRAVKARDTGPERIVRKLAWAIRPGYRLDARELPGRPDLVWRRTRRAVFVHGCFWHGHDCARGARAPKANAAYWSAKIARNRARDARVLDALRDAGWKTLTIWECELRDEARVQRTLDRFLREAR